MTYADLIGVPFVEGGRTREGLDCWGVVLELYRREGIVLKDPFACETQASVKQTQRENAEVWIARHFDQWRRVSDPAWGRVAAFRDVDGAAVHVGVLVEPGKFVHALKKSGVVVGKLDRAPWCDNLMGIYAYCPR